LAPSQSPFTFFNPRSFTGCQLWLDGYDPNGNGTAVSNGTSISSWVDKSGSNNNATQATASNRPSYLNNTIFFNGSNILSLPNGTLPSGSSDTTLFMIASVTNTSNVQYLFGAGNGVTNEAFNIYTDVNTLNLDVYGTRARGAFTSTSTNILGFTFGSSTLTIYTNGSVNSSQGTVTKSTGTANNSIGASSGSSGGSPFYITGSIGETLLYNSLLSTVQRQTVEGYLAWKWGLQGSLPSNHPYKNAPPGLNIPVVQPRLTMNTRFFLPTSITGCALWFDGMDINGNGTPFTNGASVNTWVDKSGNGRNATGTVAATYDSTGQYINFTGANYYSLATNAGSFVVNNYFTFFWVERLQASAASISRPFMGTDSTGANQGLHMSYYGTTPMRFGFFNNDLDCFPAAFVSAGSQPIRIWSFVFNPSFRAIYLNGAIQSSDANNTQLTAWSTPLIGRMFTNAYYIGFMYEILGYGGQIQNAQRQNIEGYLAWKWGLQGNLPASHPWKRWPPPPS
jgi:hypothetical protein